MIPTNDTPCQATPGLAGPGLVSPLQMALIEKLIRLHPDTAPFLESENPFQLLIAVILSAQCTDAKVNEVTRVLFRAFPTPTRLAGLSSIIAIRAGYAHALALKADGTVWSWGDNSLGQLGRGAGHAAADIAQVPGLAGAHGIHALLWASFAYGPGFLSAWGNDGPADLGLGRPTFRTAPLPVQGVTLF